MKLKENMKKVGNERVKNHSTYFTGDSDYRLLLVLPVLAFLLGTLLFSLNLPHNIFSAKGLKKEDLVLINYISLGCFSVSFLVVLIPAFWPRKNLKGILLDIEDDLLPNFHYRLAYISGDLCQIELENPNKPSLQPWTQSWKLKQLTEQFDLEFKPGLVFGKRKDGTFYFVSPDVPKGKSDEKGTASA